MAIVEALLGLLAACVVLALVARSAGLPYAVVLVLGGSALAFVPGLPKVSLDPELALAFFLPPLLMGSALRTDWRAFRASLRPILLLAVGAVLFTTLAIAVVAKFLLPDLPWAAAAALGAIVAPPDAVAAAAVLQRLRISRRVVTILEGESLVNDATALVLYRFTVAAVAMGSVSIDGVGVAFLIAALGGVVVGYGFGRALIWISLRIDDTLLETALSFLCCFAAYLAAEALHASGVIAVATAGILVGRKFTTIFSAQTRLAARAVWQFVDFVLTSLVFILVGLQLNDILDGLAGRNPWFIAMVAVTLSVALIVSRFVWVFPVTWLPRLIPALARRDPVPSWRHTTVIAWAGMRGVVSLAAALALPLDFPERNLIAFLAFCAILATLVVQGTTLEWVIKRVGAEEPAHTGLDLAEAEVLRLVADAALADVQARLDSPLDGAIAADLIPEYRDKARVYLGVAKGASRAELTARLQMRLSALRAGRVRLLAHHAASDLPDDLLLKVTQDLDFEELRLQQLLGTGRSHG